MKSILCIDGGIKGLITALMLAEIETRTAGTGKSLCLLFRSDRWHLL